MSLVSLLEARDCEERGQSMALLDDAPWTSRIYSNGWTAGGGGTHESVEPATGDVLGVIGVADGADVAAAARSARAAQPAWAATIGPERAALLRRAAMTVQANHAELATWLVREGGAVKEKAAFEVQLVLGELWEAAALPTQPWGHLLAGSEPGRESFDRRLPLGVVGGGRRCAQVIRRAPPRLVFLYPSRGGTQKGARGGRRSPRGR